MNIFRTAVVAFFLALLAVSDSAAQTIVRDLNGFRLGQYRAVTYREFGDPDKSGGSDDNIVYEAFILEEEPILYMVFQYQKKHPDTIWSIQITGDDPKHDLGFRGLRMGMSQSDVEKVLGKAERKINIQDHGTRWEFDKVNYSIEINHQNKLSSIRIVNNRPKEPDVKKLPKFIEVLKTLQSGTNAELADLFSPDMELYDGDGVKLFENVMSKEIASDSSGVFAAIRRLSKELSSVDVSKSDQYEENMRLGFERDPMHVIKLWKLKGVTEIAFTWNGEKWQIWEFGAKKPKAPAQDWKSIYTPGTLKNIISKRMPDLAKNPNVKMAKSDGKPMAEFSYNSYPISTKVKFTGETRKTSESTLNLISLWLATIGKPKELAKRFEFEVKVVEDGSEYWIPIQHPITERLTKEVKAGEEIVIYLSWVGTKYEDSKPEMLAIVNEFTTVPK